MKFTRETPATLTIRSVDSATIRIGDANYENTIALTLDDVNRVIRENLRTENMQFAFVTRDADDLRERLASDRRSPMSYDAELPQEVLDEDKLIDNIPLSFDSVETVAGDDVFM